MGSSRTERGVKLIIRKEVSVGEAFGRGKNMGQIPKAGCHYRHLEQTRGHTIWLEQSMGWAGRARSIITQNWLGAVGRPGFGQPTTKHEASFFSTFSLSHLENR
jgi:hypothetical protein